MPTSRPTVSEVSPVRPSIQSAWHYQHAGLLARAWTLPTARRLRPVFAPQETGSTCGPSSLASVFRSYGREVREGTFLGQGRPGSGLTLDQLADAARGDRRTAVLRGLELPSFREQLRLSNDPRRRYVVNFHRGPLFGRGGGHHSPIGGYLEGEDLVFVLDTNDSFRPFLVEAGRLFAAMSTIDASNGQPRGLLTIGDDATARC